MAETSSSRSSNPYT